MTELWRQVSGSAQVLERVLRPFCRAIQFTDADQFSAYDFLGWVHQTLIRPLRARLGGYNGARDESIFRPFAEYDGYVLVPYSHTPVYQDQARRTYPYAKGSRLSVIVSPADEMLDWDDDAIAMHVTSVLGRANPKIAAAAVRKRAVIKHPRHLIRPLPGAMTRRPG